jgi:hypothetical protein
MKQDLVKKKHINKGNSFFFFFYQEDSFYVLKLFGILILIAYNFYVINNIAKKNNIFLLKKIH